MYVSSETWQSSSERSMCAPSPVRSRRKSAPAIENAPNMPPARSAIGKPMRTGRPPASPATDLAGHRHRTAHRLQRQVEGRPVTIGAVLAVGRDFADDDPLVERPELRVRQAEPLHDARPEVLPDHVRLPDEVVEDLAPPIAR